MNSYEWDRAFDVRCRSKRGENITQSEQDFCFQMYDKYPAEYRAMKDIIDVETNPNPFK